MFRSILIRIVFLLSLFAGSGVLAQTSAAIEVDIPAQPVGDALNQFAEQSGLQVVLYADDAEGVETTAVAGKFDDSELVLDALLASTGLEYFFINDRTVSVSSLDDDKGGDSDSKNSSPAPTLMAQNTTQAPTTVRSSRNEENGTSVVTGRVIDARTGANLRGAKVTIEETGQWTSTGNLGRFRFASVPEGQFTLSVSFLGYAGQSSTVVARDGSLVQNFALRGGDEIEEIVVFGTRSARALALNQERTAANTTTVLSSDFLGRFDGDTVSDVLRRAPGVAFIQDEGTGDGVNVIIRGLEPDLNTVTLNGLRLPEGSGRGRSADLSGILTDSISEITINKSLLPSQDGTGTGGLVDITTKGPMDRARQLASFGIQGTNRADDFGDGLIATGTLSRTFGSSESFGLSASVQYREQDRNTLGYNVTATNPEFFPLGPDDQPVTSDRFLNPLENTFPFDAEATELRPFGVSYSGNGSASENLSMTITSQWNPSDTTKLRADYVRTDADVDSFGRGVNFFAVTVPTLLPIEELNGEERYVRVWRNAFLEFSEPGPLTLVSRNFGGGASESSTKLLSFGGTTELGKWTLSYGAGHTTAETSSDSYFVGGRNFISTVPNYLDILLPEALENQRGGVLLSPFEVLSGDRAPIPLFNDQGYEQFNNSNNIAYQNFDSDRIQGENSRDTFTFSARYDFDQRNIQSIEIGAFYERSRLDSLSFRTRSASLSDFSANQLGLGGLSDNVLAPIGQSAGFLVNSRREIGSFVSGFDSLAEQLGLDVTRNTAASTGNVDAFTEERNLAAYLEADLQFGRLDLVGGFRFEQVEVQSVNPLTVSIRDADGFPDTDAEDAIDDVLEGTGTQTKLLPRFAATFRYSDNLLFRGAYFKTVGRPRVANLSRPESFLLDMRERSGPNLDQPSLRFTKSNPDLEPVVIDNYDAGIEYYFENLGLLKLSVFYKELSNILDDTNNIGVDALEGITLPDSPAFQNLPDNIFIEGNLPQNSPYEATIWGFELAAERQLTFLPGVWSGLGAFGNYAYTKSDRTYTREFFIEDELVDVEIESEFANDPKHSGSIGITYNNNNFDGSISYTYQDRRLNFYQDFGLSAYSESDESLDARIEYRFDVVGGELRLFVEGSDLLKGTEDPDVRNSIGGVDGAPEFFTGGNYLGGRALTLGILGTF